MHQPTNNLPLAQHKPSKEEAEERARNRAHKLKLKRLREEDCVVYEDDEDEGIN